MRMVAPHITKLKKEVQLEMEDKMVEKKEFANMKKWDLFYRIRMNLLPC